MDLRTNRVPNSRYVDRQEFSAHDLKGSKTVTKASSISGNKKAASLLKNESSTLQVTRFTYKKAKLEINYNLDTSTIERFNRNNLSVSAMSKNENFDPNEDSNNAEYPSSKCTINTQKSVQRLPLFSDVLSSLQRRKHLDIKKHSRTSQKEDLNSEYISNLEGYESSLSSTSTTSSSTLVQYETNHSPDYDLYEMIEDDLLLSSADTVNAVATETVVDNFIPHNPDVNIVAIDSTAQKFCKNDNSMFELDLSNDNRTYNSNDLSLVSNIKISNNFDNNLVINYADLNSNHANLKLTADNNFQNPHNLNVNLVKKTTANQKYKISLSDENNSNLTVQNRSNCHNNTANLLSLNNVDSKITENISNFHDNTENLLSLNNIDSKITENISNFHDNTNNLLSLNNVDSKITEFFSNFHDNTNNLLSLNNVDSKTTEKSSNFHDNTNNLLSLHNVDSKLTDNNLKFYETLSHNIDFNFTQTNSDNLVNNSTSQNLSKKFKSDNLTKVTCNLLTQTLMTSENVLKSDSINPINLNEIDANNCIVQELLPDTADVLESVQLNESINSFTINSNKSTINLKSYKFEVICTLPFIYVPTNGSSAKLVTKIDKNLENSSQVSSGCCGDAIKIISLPENQEQWSNLVNKNSQSKLIQNKVEKITGISPIVNRPMDNLIESNKPNVWTNNDAGSISNIGNCLAQNNLVDLNKSKISIMNDNTKSYRKSTNLKLPIKLSESVKSISFPSKLNHTVGSSTAADNLIKIKPNISKNVQFEKDKSLNPNHSIQLKLPTCHSVNNEIKPIKVTKLASTNPKLPVGLVKFNAIKSKSNQILNVNSLLKKPILKLRSIDSKKSFLVDLNNYDLNPIVPNMNASMLDPPKKGLKKPNLKKIQKESSKTSSGNLNNYDANNRNKKASMSIPPNKRQIKLPTAKSKKTKAEGETNQKRDLKLPGISSKTKSILQKRVTAKKLPKNKFLQEICTCLSNEELQFKTNCSEIQKMILQDDSNVFTDQNRPDNSQVDTEPKMTLFPITNVEHLIKDFSSNGRVTISRQDIAMDNQNIVVGKPNPTNISDYPTDNAKTESRPMVGNIVSAYPTDYSKNNLCPFFGNIVLDTVPRSLNSSQIISNYPTDNSKNNSCRTVSNILSNAPTKNPNIGQITSDSSTDNSKTNSFSTRSPNRVQIFSNYTDNSKTANSCPTKSPNSGKNVSNYQIDNSMTYSYPTVSNIVSDTVAKSTNGVQVISDVPNDNSMIYSYSTNAYVDCPKRSPNSATQNSGCPIDYSKINSTFANFDYPTRSPNSVKISSDYQTNNSMTNLWPTFANINYLTGCPIISDYPANNSKPNSTIANIDDPIKNPNSVEFISDCPTRSPNSVPQTIEYPTDYSMKNSHPTLANIVSDIPTSLNSIPNVANDSKKCFSYNVDNISSCPNSNTNIESSSQIIVEANIPNDQPIDLSPNRNRLVPLTTVDQFVDDGSWQWKQYLTDFDNDPYTQTFSKKFNPTSSEWDSVKTSVSNLSTNELSAMPTVNNAESLYMSELEYKFNLNSNNLINREQLFIMSKNL